MTSRRKREGKRKKCKKGEKTHTGFVESVEGGKGYTVKYYMLLSSPARRAGGGGGEMMKTVGRSNIIVRVPSELRERRERESICNSQLHLKEASRYT